MKSLKQLGISPAPWKVDDRELGCDNEICCEYLSDIIIKGEKRTKVVAKCNAYFDTYKPDAHLIAAAPELYEALAAMLSCAEKEAPFTTGSGISISMDMARKAIKKAGGEE